MERTYRYQEGDDLECIMDRLLVLRLIVSIIRPKTCETTVLKVGYRDDYLGKTCIHEEGCNVTSVKPERKEENPH